MVGGSSPRLALGSVRLRGQTSNCIQRALREEATSQRALLEGEVSIHSNPPPEPELPPTWAPSFQAQCRPVKQGPRSQPNPQGRSE